MLSSMLCARAVCAPKDPEENHNLASNASFADVFHKLLTRFRYISSTGVPMAGLPPALLAADDRTKCAALNQTGAFEPFGGYIAWPQPGNIPPHPPVAYQCPSTAAAECVHAPVGSNGVVFSSAATCVAKTVCAACTKASLEHACVHEFRNQIRNLTVKTFGDCCAACIAQKAPACVQWQHNPIATYHDGRIAQNCALKSVVAAPKPGSQGKCVSGHVSRPAQ